ncbi:unnamed protein product [Adineta steineri]|uniref:AMP-dependent synthetase/ligase domain-containing protein n=1 Tax=Adineta steineri TaxID=433720 RepID=A0A815XKM7_9BILA|nr:unnamed protein product [Adineta steineri]CAF1558653.1 unnamed protein product [Adineta steineri]
MLPNERLFIQSMNNTQVLFPSATCMLHEFIYQIQLRHRNFTQFLRSFVYADILTTKTDTIIQMARCSFDNHLLSLIGTLTIKATLIMLRPEGHMDLDYLAGVLNEKQITTMYTAPSLWNSLFNFLNNTNRKSSVH